MEDWQRKVVDDKMRDRVSRNTSKELLATYSGTGGIKEDDLKLKLMREEHRKKQREAKHAMSKYKKKEMSQDDIKLRALRDEQRRLQEDAERANHNYKKTELSEDDLKLRALREEDRKRQQDAEKMWRTFQNNDVKTKTRAVRQDVTHPPVESNETEDSLANITAGSVSVLSAALKHGSPPRKVENTRTKSQRPGDADYPSGTMMSHSYDEGDDYNDNDSATGLVADPCDSPRRGAVAAAAARFSGLSPSGFAGDYTDYSRSTDYSQRSNTDYNSRSSAGATAADQSTEHTDYDFSANQDEGQQQQQNPSSVSVVSETTSATKPAEAEEEEAAPESESAVNDDDKDSATDAKEDDEEPPSESPPVVEESEQEPSEKPVEDEPVVVVPTEQPVESAEKEAEPVASENADEIEVFEQPVEEQEPVVVVAEKEEPVVEPADEIEVFEQPVEEQEPVVVVAENEEPVVEPAVVEKEEPVVEPEPVIEPDVVEKEEPAKEPVVTEEESVVKEEPGVTVVEAEPAKEPAPIVAEKEPTKEPEKSEKEAPEKSVEELAADVPVKKMDVAGKPVVKKERTKKSKKVPLQPAAYTQPSEESKVVKRAQYIDAQSGEEKKFEVNDDILHVLDDAEETKPLVGQTSKVRLDVLFSFGLLTTSKKPSFTNYLLAVEDIVQRTLIDKPDVAKHVSYDKEFGPFVQEYNKDDTYVDPKGRDHVRRVVVIAAIPVFLSNGISIRTARESICAGLQGAIVSGEFVYLAKTTFNQKKQKQ